MRRNLCGSATRSSSASVLCSDSRWRSGAAADRVRCASLPRDLRAGTESEVSIEGDVARWVEGAVIGLGLCPFAVSVWMARSVRIRVSDAEDIERAVFDTLEEATSLLETGSVS